MGLGWSDWGKKGKLELRRQFMLVAFTGTGKMWSFSMLFLNWPPSVQYRNETSHGGSQTLFNMENFIGLVSLLAFFHFRSEQRRPLEENTLYDPPDVLSNAIHWLFPLILAGEGFWLIGNGWYGAIKNRWRHRRSQATLDCPYCPLPWCMHPALTDGWRYQNGWIFGKVPMGERVIFNLEIYVADFGPLNRAFWAWN